MTLFLTRLMMVFAVMSVSGLARADECPAQWGDEEFHEKVIAAIQAAPDCFLGVNIAESCGMGNSADQLVFGAATDKCVAVFAKNKKELALYRSLARRCEKKYADISGTMYLSMNAACKMDSAELVADLNTPVDFSE